MTTAFDSATLGAIVAADYRTAAVLERFGLDFCCGGRRTLDEACAQQGVDASEVLHALAAVPTSAVPQEVPDASWAADRLADYIVARHHTYVRAQVPVISAQLARLQEVHGTRHPELATIAAHFGAVADELRLHMMKEEEILFPYVRALAAAATHGTAPPPAMFGTVANPIRMMEMEHQSAGNGLELLKALSGNFTVPADGCATYRACFAELEAFDRDLRMHIHLENNLLYPRAVALEAGGRPGGQTLTHPAER